MDNTQTIIVSALVGGVVSYLGAIIKNKLDMNRTIDNELREKRDKVYKYVWRRTGSLPRRPRLESVTYLDITNLMVDLGTWYYEEGGLYLSGGARRAFSATMDILERVRQNGNETDVLVESDYEEAREACSKLRSGLSQELLSRRAAPYGFRKPRF